MSVRARALRRFALRPSFFSPLWQLKCSNRIDELRELPRDRPRSIERSRDDLQHLIVCPVSGKTAGTAAIAAVRASPPAAVFGVMISTMRRRLRSVPTLQNCKSFRKNLRAQS